MSGIVSSPSLWGAVRAGGMLRTLALCLGVWLHAADSLVAATVMPSAVRDIGGAALIYWTVALYQLGSIVAGAATGVLVVRLGLSRAMSVAALIYALGCAVSALAPDMSVMLAGRLLQGLGGGWMMALAFVGVTQLFPAGLWPQLIALISGVWGISALTGPLVGGLFASAGLWRGAFWAFAGQALLLLVLMPLLPGAGTAVARVERLPWRRLVLLSLGVLAVLQAGMQDTPLQTAGLVAAGLLLLALFLIQEAGAAVRLFPRAVLDPRTPWGPGFIMILAMSTATVSFMIYGPYLMETLHGVSPLTGGFVLAVESVAWSLAAIVFAGATVRQEPLLIRAGVICIGAGTVGFALLMPHGPVAWLLPWALLQGAGFGMCWAFVVRRLVARVDATDRERTSSAAPTLQMIGYALGAALAGMVANGLGLGDGVELAVVREMGFWVFAAFWPLAVVGIWGGWRLAERG